MFQKMASTVPASQDVDEFELETTDGRRLRAASFSRLPLIDVKEGTDSTGTPETVHVEEDIVAARQA